ncbi:MAG: type II toxin-antitoxin system HipA family toxin [Candidatus Methylumidiphilus sp.]
MKRDVDVFLRDAAQPVGKLTFTVEGRRQSCSFEYDARWLAAPNRFQIDPALPLVRGTQYRSKGQTDRSSSFFGCFADSEPDGWGIQVIERDHAKSIVDARGKGKAVDSRALNDLDYLLAVDDVSRVGALRLMVDGKFVRASVPGRRTTPPLIEIRELITASHAVESGTETANDLAYLRGRGTSLGGMRPKCSVIDDDESLCIAKFPSVRDTRAVTKGEVLALRLASLAGIEAAKARTIYSDDIPVTLVTRFDRADNGRLMYASARTLLQVDDDADHTYTEIVDAIVQNGFQPDKDRQELWRRMVFNILINNVDDHLNNHGFIHMSSGRWKLAPAFDINPFPDKSRILKTWISEAAGPEASVAAAMEAAGYFKLGLVRAREVLGEVLHAVGQWREVAVGSAVGMSRREAGQFEMAFESNERLVAEREIKASSISKRS